MAANTVSSPPKNHRASAAIVADRKNPSQSLLSKSRRYHLTINAAKHRIIGRKPVVTQSSRMQRLIGAASGVAEQFFDVGSEFGHLGGVETLAQQTANLGHMLE